MKILAIDKKVIIEASIEEVKMLTEGPIKAGEIVEISKLYSNLISVGVMSPDMKNVAEELHCMADNISALIPLMKRNENPVLV